MTNKNIEIKKDKDGNVVSIDINSSTKIKKIKGEPGDPGIPGIQGKNGTNGKNGEEGVMGQKGEKGEGGDKGQKGERGNDGVKGKQGQNGKKGENGKDAEINSIVIEEVNKNTDHRENRNIHFDDEEQKQRVLDQEKVTFVGGGGGFTIDKVIDIKNDNRLTKTNTAQVGNFRLEETGIVVDDDNNITAFDITANAITISDIALTGAEELTIDSGAVTITRGHHSINTEGDAANDDLDTINGGRRGDIIFILAKNDDRTVRIRNGVGNIFLKHQVESKSYPFSSPSGSSGIFYTGGYYNWNSIDANLNQGSLSVNHSSVNGSSACHIGIVAGGAGVVDTGVVKLVVTGTTIDDEAIRTTSQTITLVDDITTLSADQYIETQEKFLGQVTLSLAVASGSPVNFNLDINYGCTKYEDFSNQAFTITSVEAVGRAGANDTGFNLRLFHHSTADWTYAASGFIPGGTVLGSMNTDHGTEKNLASGEPFAWKRANLNTDIFGDNGEGLIMEITTSSNKSVETMALHFGVHTAPNFAYMSTTKQHLIFMKHGNNWLEL